MPAILGASIRVGSIPARQSRRSDIRRPTCAHADPCSIRLPSRRPCRDRGNQMWEPAIERSHRRRISSPATRVRMNGPAQSACAARRGPERKRLFDRGASRDDIGIVGTTVSLGGTAPAPPAGRPRGRRWAPGSRGRSPRPSPAGSPAAPSTARGSRPRTAARARARSGG